MISLSEPLSLFSNIRADQVNLWLARLLFGLLLIWLGLWAGEASWHLLLPKVEPSPVAGVSEPGADESPGLKSFQLAPLQRALKQHNPWESMGRVAQPKPSGLVSRKEAVTESKLDLLLIGTMVASEFHQWAIVVRKKNKQQQIILRPGDRIDDATVEKIQRNSVYFRNGERLEILTAEVDGIPAGANAAKPGQPSRAVLLNMGRRDFNALADQGLALLQGVNVVPYFQGKTSVGYQLNTREKADLLGQFGLQDGDVVQRVNGANVSKPGEIGPIMNGIRSQSLIEIDYIRKGQPESVRLQIDG